MACAARSATSLQSAHRPRAAPHRSVPARAAQRASCLSSAPRLPSRRPACGNESGSFAACRRARLVPRAAPPPSLPCQAPRRAFAARTRGVDRRETPSRRGPEARLFYPGRRSAVTRDAGFLRPPLGTAPLAPVRQVAARVTAPARRGGATKADCHVRASAGRRTTCRTAPPLARVSSKRAWRARASRTQRVALARRVTALQLMGNVERRLRARLTITARNAASGARPWCPSVTL